MDVDFISQSLNSLSFNELKDRLINLNNIDYKIKIIIYDFEYYKSY